jgi:hypothetical protein
LTAIDAVAHYGRSYLVSSFSSSFTSFFAERRAGV